MMMGFVRIETTQKLYLQLLGCLTAFQQKKEGYPEEINPKKTTWHTTGSFLSNFRFTCKKKKPLGNDLLSQEVALQVPSALTALTTGFEMLPGVPLSLQSPRDLIHLLSLPKINRIVCSPQKSAEFPAPHEEALDH